MAAIAGVGAAWFLVFLAPSPAQPAKTDSDEASRLFGLTNLWTIRLTLHSADWAAMQPTGSARPGPFPRSYPWTTCTFECAGQTLTNVAIRFKGNSSFGLSRAGLKHPFKLDFNRAAKGRTFLGVEELALNNNFNDATQFRESLAYEAYRRAGLPAPRTAFARVYLTLTGERTNTLLGLYTLVEVVETEFLKSHFGTKKGLLLKPERLRSLEYLGPDWNAYTDRFDPKTAVKPDDAQQFIALTRLIAEADDSTLARELPRQLDLDNFLRYLAVTALLANYDSFLGNGHNYYLFQPARGGKAMFIPWDLNEAFGGHPMAGSRRAQANLSTLHPHAGQNRLIDRVLANPNWAARYRSELTSALTNACDPTRLLADAALAARVVQDTVFAESPLAKASFQRIALGQTNLALPEPPRAGRGPSPEGPFPGGPRPNRPADDGLARDRGPEFGPGRGPGRSRNAGPGRGFGPGPGPGREEMTLADWIVLRFQNVSDELAGRRNGTILQMQMGPFGPGDPRPRNLDPQLILPSNQSGSRHE